jgi:deoxyribonuclease-4
MSIAGGLPRAVERAHATGCDTLQIFTKSSGQWRARALPPDEVNAFRARATELGIGPIVAHASYLINLAAPDPDLRRRSIAALTGELDRADALGLAGVVLHPGSYTTGTERGGLRRVAAAIEEVFESRPPGGAGLLLEHTAGQGTNLGHRFEHLSVLLDGNAATDRLGICLDTCHLLAAGYDIATADGYARTFDEFDARIGLSRLKVLHLNDSKHPCGSRKDRHDHIGQGCVGLEAFGRLVCDARLAAVPMILETPKAARDAGRVVAADPADLRNLATLRALIG